MIKRLLIYIFSNRQMIPIEKLRANLVQSQRWGAAFKDDIKKCMQEITTKNEQIAKLGRENINLSAMIQKCKSQIKGYAEQNQKNCYKSSRLQIKVEELEARVKVYQDGLRKKMEWNSQLKTKIVNLQLEIERQRNSLSQEQFFDMIDSSPSQNASAVSGLSSNHKSFKESSLKLAYTAPRNQMDIKVDRMNNLQKEFVEIMGRLKKGQYELQKAKRVGDRLKQNISAFNSENKENKSDNKQNLSQKSNKYDDSFDRQTRIAVTKVREMEQIREKLNKEIQNERKWIENLYNSVASIVSCDTSTDQLRRDMVNLQRQLKREKCTMKTISNIIKDANS